MENLPQPENSEFELDPQDPDFFTILSISFELFLIPVAWFIAWLWPGPIAPVAHFTMKAAWLGIVSTLPLLIFLAVISWTPVKRLQPIRRIRRRIRRLLGPTLMEIKIWQILAISMVAGVGEEVLFRGAIQGRVDIVISSLLFGLLHWITPTYAILAAVMGAYLGWLFKATDNLLVPVMVHALYDFVALLVIRHEVRRHGLPTKQAAGEGAR